MDRRVKYAHLKGKRIGAVDYGRKRVGFAVCDEFHITVNPRRILDFGDEDFYDQLKSEIDIERIDALVIGVPYRTDGKKTAIIEEIYEMIAKLREILSIEIIPFDESYSSVRAMETMIEIGKKKKDRRKKGSADRIAAAIILRDFLSEIDN